MISGRKSDNNPITTIAVKRITWSVVNMALRIFRIFVLYIEMSIDKLTGSEVFWK